ncbi:inactive transglutaminase family protein [uncultured Abyssibacter sp.]|uniref:inactive transglutaminase family protein n=1 Tax=uncultured Abyssibacter sp. TaxID=2320202 RepID=UPI0032B21EA9
MRNLPVWIIAALLMAAGAAMCAYKVRALGLPLLPSTDTAVWTVEARAAFRARGGPVKATLLIPKQPPGFEHLDEHYISNGFGVTQEASGLNRAALWAVRRANGTQAVYYRLTVYETDTDNPTHQDPFPGYPRVPDYGESTQAAVNALLNEVRSESADIATFARALIARMNREGANPSVDSLRTGGDSPGAWAQWLVDVLAGARIPARVIWGLPLVDGTRDATLVPYIEVHNEQRWIPMSPETGKVGLPDDFLVWRIGNDPLLAVDGGAQPDVRFSVTRSQRQIVSIARDRARQHGSLVLDYSLFSLPVQTQNVYRVLLTVPLGAFLVVLLRNVVGVKTFGTFMPILIALAFRETKLIWGIVLFTLIVALGLGLRFALERLKLLLVPRLASVLIIVILLMLLVSLVSHHLGMDRGLSIALFPMVILAMTIERMSLVWEEHGAWEAILQGGGSLLVAAAGFLVMSNPLLTHLVFVFPELLLVLLGACLILGRYTGYRLSEFWRFRAVLAGKDQ